MSHLPSRASSYLRPSGYFDGRALAHAEFGRIVRNAMRVETLW